MASIQDYLPKFNYIEPNNLKGKQAGLVIAQMEIKTTDVTKLCVIKSGGKFLENGTICSISAEGITVPVKDSTLFIAYNDPLLTLYNDDRFYATNIANETPRLIQLFPGDEWTATKELDLTSETSVLKGRIVEISTGNKWYAEKFMADGVTPAHHYMFLG